MLPAMLFPADIARSVPSLFIGTGVFAKVILVVLFVISVTAWAIMWDRARLYLRLHSKGKALRRALHSKGVAGSIAQVDQYLPSVEGSILLEARRYVSSRSADPDKWGLVVEDASTEEVERKKLREALERRAVGEISEMERLLIFLSTTAAVAPFLGLLGTVWGIMSSFLSMGAEGAASLEVVGPGIAEALVTTIAGLGAAIPALIGYNVLVRNVHRKETAVDLFISQIVEQTILARGRAGGSRSGDRRSPSRASV